MYSVCTCTHTYICIHGTYMCTSCTMHTIVTAWWHTTFIFCEKNKEDAALKVFLHVCRVSRVHMTCTVFYFYFLNNKINFNLFDLLIYYCTIAMLVYHLRSYLLHILILAFIASLTFKIYIQAFFVYFHFWSSSK
jgi:hypothetical protein